MGMLVWSPFHKKYVTHFLQVAIVVLNIFFTVRGPGFPWSPKAEGVMTPKDDGYAAFPDQDVSDDNYQPPEY